MQDNSFSMPDRMESRRLVLSPMSLQELKELQKEGQKLLPESVLSDIIRKAVRNKILKMEQMPKDVHSWFTYWRILKKEDGMGMGLVGSKGLPGEDGFVELGYGMAKEYRRMGYMAEGLNAYLDWLYQCPFCRGARLRILSANFPSVKTAESCGFERAGQEDIYLIYVYRF